MAIILKVVARNENTGVTREFDTKVTEAQYVDVMEVVGQKRPAVSKEELMEKTIAALAKQVELLDQCDNAESAYLLNIKMSNLRKLLLTL